jgi:phosphate transport system permease protein
MHLPFSKSVLSAGLTLALVILPIVIIASQEAIRGVPATLREAAFGMGATRWQVVRGAVLPSATPGIMTGAILAMSRAIGEAAPLLAVMGGVLGTTNQLSSLMDKTPALPVTIFKWASDENQGFEHLSAAAIIVLLAFLLLMNSVAILIRYRFEKKLGTK